MNTLWGILLGSFFIGFSGAMMPGPMLGVTIDGSLKKGYSAGPLVVLGHGILELVLILVMALGLKDFFSDSTVAGYIGVIGGIYLGWMGFGMIKSSLTKTVTLEMQGTRVIGGRGLVLAGAVVSLTNPYFILWWATTGIELIRQSSSLGWIGLLLFFSGHILADFSWFTAISITFSKGKRLINDIIYQRIILLLGVFLLGFAAYFIKSGWGMV